LNDDSTNPQGRRTGTKQNKTKQIAVDGEMNNQKAARTNELASSSQLTSRIKNSHP